jgi:hypothetical protein
MKEARFAISCWIPESGRFSPLAVAGRLPKLNVNVEGFQTLLDGSES